MNRIEYLGSERYLYGHIRGYDETKIIAMLPATVTLPIAIDQDHKFSVPKDQLRFFDYWLKGIDDGFSTEPPVRIFVMGDNVWRYADDWPLPETRYRELYLHEGGALLSSVPGSEPPAWPGTCTPNPPTR